MVKSKLRVQILRQASPQWTAPLAGSRSAVCIRRRRFSNPFEGFANEGSLPAGADQTGLETAKAAAFVGTINTMVPGLASDILTCACSWLVSA